MTRCISHADSDWLKIAELWLASCSWLRIKQSVTFSGQFDVSVIQTIQTFAYQTVSYLQWSVWCFYDSNDSNIVRMYKTPNQSPHIWMKLNPSDVVLNLDWWGSRTVTLTNSARLPGVLITLDLSLRPHAMLITRFPYCHSDKQRTATWSVNHSGFVTAAARYACWFALFLAATSDQMCTKVTGQWISCYTLVHAFVSNRVYYCCILLAGLRGVF